MDRRPIRVMFVVPSLVVGGAERHATTLLTKMDRSRFVPSVVCIGEEGELFADLRAEGIEARALHLGDKRRAWRALRELVSSMGKLQPDVVVLRGYNAEVLGRIAARVTGVRRTVVWLHSMGDIEPRGAVRQLMDRALTRWTSNYFGVANAQIPFLTDGLGCPPDKVRIIHNGVDTAVFEARDDKSALHEFGFAESDPVVGIVAALRPEKDHATLLHAARIVVGDLPNAKFLIVGEGAARSELEAMCVELGIASNVRFAGTRDGVGRLLRAIDVFTLCSVTECFPISLLEAMACGRPAVCTDVGGIGEVLDDGVSGYRVPVRNPQALAARLTHLLSHRDVAHQFGLAGRRRVESEFDLDRSIAAAERALEDVVYGRGKSSTGA